jgi:ERCC4-type nuclease
MRLVDSREPWDLREKMLMLGWEQKALIIGDMCFDSHDKLLIGSTRKKLEDLLGSMDELFAYQLEQMLEHYAINIFMFEAGPIYCTKQGNIITKITVKGQEEDKIWNITRTQLFNWLHSWQVKGFVLERWPNLEYTALRLQELYTLYQKPYSLSSKSRKYRDDRVLALCSGLRGKIGQEALENHSIAGLCMMGTRQLEELPGFGKKRALSLFNHLHRKPREEQSKCLTL